MSGSTKILPEFVEAIEDYERLRAGPDSDEKRRATKVLLGLLRAQRLGVTHGGFRYLYSQSEDDIVRIIWPPPPPGRNAYWRDRREAAKAGVHRASDNKHYRTNVLLEDD